MKYFEIPELEHVYLEDNYVLSVIEQGNMIAFELDVVLTESHLFYLPPKKAEQYCYKKATLSFSEVSSIVWKKKNFRKVEDVAEGIDFGNIDVFINENCQFFISGDWGEVVIKSRKMSVIFKGDRNKDVISGVPEVFL